ncbi:biliverdin-producing heme oxygenase [Microbacterium azadirachtae]|uniref:Heme oxygenase n=1 Tax=Microbacterium azadirachtae TaxID=582680 RepID=A0A0F0LGF1_9MICO|nr:biliverdin-producing heme oxygenase [Microbacterium azadirachtae]KJL31360.1 Heme oxygenase [Microbacterium azadirachtae]
MSFDDAVVTAVTAHMNGDHADDNVLIARAFGHPAAVSASMIGLDADAGRWRVADADGEHELVVPWPGAPLAERSQIRRATVMLHRAACERLGVPAREEHAPAPHGHGGTEGAPDGFARRLREATWSDHGDSEGATFMSDIMRGRSGLREYAELAAQHWFLYEALDDAARLLAADPLLAALHPEGLGRVAALERDLAHLLGSDWRAGIRPVPATAAYAGRIRELAGEGWLAGVVAHHYTRYLGDLSGGQAIARRVAGRFGLDGDGIAFYDFAAVGDPAVFKDSYRRVLDELGERLDADEQGRMFDEVRAAYRFNTDVFLDLGAAQLSA